MADFNLNFIRLKDYDCLCFCDHLYVTYRNKLKIKKLTFIERGREMLLYCDYSFNEKIIKYCGNEGWSKEFFDDVK